MNLHMVVHMSLCTMYQINSYFASFFGEENKSVCGLRSLERFNNMQEFQSCHKILSIVFNWSDFSRVKCVRL